MSRRWVGLTVDNINVVALQYLGQVLSATTEAYGLKLPAAGITALTALNAINGTFTTDTFTSTTRQLEALQQIASLLTEPMSDALTGTLWLYPCAGFVLLLCALRSWIWYRLSGTDNLIVHGGMTFFGVALGLLGLLNIGPTRLKLGLGLNGEPTTIPTAPLYLLMYRQTALLIILGAYAVVHFGILGTMVMMKRKRAGGMTRSG